MDIAQQRPVDYFAIPPDERERRVHITSDLCSIDDERYFIRGYLPLPVHDNEQEFGWGVWAEVAAPSFFRYLELYETNGSDEPPFRGRLAADLGCYQPSTYQLPIQVQPRRAEDRPLLIFPNHVHHPLASEQRTGITMERVYEILHSSLPELFPSDQPE